LEFDGGKLGFKVESVEEGEQLVDVDEGIFVARGEERGDRGLGSLLGGGEMREGGDGVSGAFFVGDGHYIGVI
jgi:hypothetical protein